MGQVGYLTLGGYSRLYQAKCFVFTHITIITMTDCESIPVIRMDSGMSQCDRTAEITGRQI